MMEIDVNQELKIKFEAGSIKGEDGITPHIGDNGNWYVDGTDTGVHATGERGEPGQPGYTPVKGKDYFDGQPGQPGKDGISPVVKVTDIENGHRVTITTGSDVQSFDVLNGKDGEGGGTADAVAWENVTGKPFNESLTGTAIADGDTLRWDGDKDAMPIMIGNAYTKFCYVSDNVPTMEQISAGHTLVLKTYTGTEVNINVTPSEHDGYISFSDVDGQYLHIIKKPCTIGINTFERAGIYFYAQGDSTAHICRLTINGYTFTEMDSIKDAYIPQTIARKSDIPQGGGAQVQSDWNQHDATALDYVKNRVAYPAYSPVLLEETTSYSMGDFVSYGGDGTKTYPAPVEGKRYTFCAGGGNVYTGVAVSGEFDVSGDLITGIGIVDEQGRDALAVHIELGSITGWFVKIPEFVVSVGAHTTTPLVIIEGESAYKKRTVPDDVIMSGEGMNIVYEFKNLQENADYIQALMNDVEIVVGYADGAEHVFTQDDLTIFGDASNILDGVMYMYGDTAFAMLAPMDETGASIMLALVDEGSAGFVKSFKVNYPGIFAPVVEAKKIPAECLPGAFIAYTDMVSDDGMMPGIFFESALVNISKFDDVMQALKSGRPMYVCIVSDTGETSSYYTVLRVDEEGNNVYLRYLYDDMTIRSCVAYRI